MGRAFRFPIDRIVAVGHICTLSLILFAYMSLLNGLLSGIELPQESQKEVCPSVCQTMYPSSTMKSYSTLTDSTESRHRLIIVHITNNTLSPYFSVDDDVFLDINDLLWAESVEEPLLSLDLSFNVYSLTTLSSKVRHLTTTVQVQPENCFRNMPSMFCAVSNVARGFLANVTKRRGVLCYVVGPNLNYKCCQWDKITDDVKCSIPVVRTATTTAIMVTLAIAAGLAILCFPAIVNILPDKDPGNQMTSNSHLNPFSQAAISVIRSLYLTGHYYWLDVLRKLFMFLGIFPFLFYIQVIILVYIKNYEIPKMFGNSAVAKLWNKSLSNFFNTTYINSAIFLGVLFCLVPQSKTFSVSDSSSKFYAKFVLIRSLKEEKRHLKLDFCFPFSFYFRHVVRKTFSCIRYAVSLRNFHIIPGFVAIFLTSLILSPFICAVFFVVYLYSVSPLGKMVDICILHLMEFSIFSIWCRYKMFKRFENPVVAGICSILVLIPLIISSFAQSVGIVMFSMIIYISLSLITKLISYTAMGLAANLSIFSPYIALVSIFLFYAWSCCTSVTSEYHKLLKLTIEACEQKQKEHPDIEKGLVFKEEGRVLSIPSTLFHEICDEVLPRTEAYTFMVLKLITITLFMTIAFTSIMVFGEKAGLSQLMTVFATLLAGILPKLVSILGQGSSAKDLQDLALPKRVKTIIENSNYLQYLRENPSQQVDVDIDYPDLSVELVDMSEPCVDNQQLTRDTLDQDCQQENAHTTRELVDSGDSQVVDSGDSQVVDSGDSQVVDSSNSEVVDSGDRDVMSVEADVHPVPPLLQSTSDTVQLIPSAENQASRDVIV